MKIEERHEREQYFFDDATIVAVAEMLAPMGRVCVLCAPMVGAVLEKRGCGPIVLDVDERFSHLRGFRRWDLHRPTHVNERFDVVFVDPPFFNLSLSQMFTAVRLLAQFDFTQRLAITYLARRKDAILDSFAMFQLRPTGFQPTYQTVDTAERNEIELFANFELKSESC